ncbi:MAG: RNA polymerase sigma factor [Nocardioidaceae bacterium]
MDDVTLVVRLREGDEAAFTMLVVRHGEWLLRVAEDLVSSRAVAEEVLQDTWLAVYLGVDGFEGRSSLKTWLTSILANRARTALARERRYLTLRDEDIDRIAGATSAWSLPLVPWTDGVDERVTARQLMRTVREVLPRLPDAQRDVVVLRDVERARPVEVTELLGLSDANQRVLLHRARSRLRRHLAPALEPT